MQVGGKAKVGAEKWFKYNSDLSSKWNKQKKKKNKKI